MKMKDSVARKLYTKAAALLLVLALGVTAAGCSSTEEKLMEEATGVSSDVSANGNEDSISRADSAANAGMGRYVESNVLTRENYGMMNVHKTIEGKWILYDGSGNKYVSTDNCESWEIEESDWLSEFAAEHYVIVSAASVDGTVALAYAPREVYQVQYLLAAPDGTQTPFDIEPPDEKSSIGDFCFTDSGRLFACMYGDNKVYEINTDDGSIQETVTLENNLVYIRSCQKDILLCATDDEVYLYDLTQKTFVEDESLQDFIRENYSNVEALGDNCYNLNLFGGEENIVYLAGKKGLHRHVIGGGSVEQVIDGSLSSFGDPSHQIEYVTFLENQDFLALFSDGKVIKFSYDADVPTVPNDQLVVYSLEENNTIRQAISAYQTEYPDMYVTYTIGMEGDGVTREDALKKLNTELLSGSGPDVLVLDKMPIDSYVDKGVLMDISKVIEEIDSEEGLLMNLVTPLYTKDSLYITPVEFMLPMIAGHQKDIVKADNYEGIADTIEAIRKENPDVDLIKKSSETGVISTFFMICEPSWKQEDGGIQEENLKDYLRQSKRIYDAQMDGTPQKAIDWYRSMDSYYLEEYGEHFESSRYFNVLQDGSYVTKEAQLMCGAAWGIDDYAGALSAARINGLEDTQVKRMNGQSKNVYCPVTLTGINEAAGNREKAVLFLKTLLVQEVQEMTHYGYPVNKKAFDSKLLPDTSRVQSDGAFSWVGTSDAEGNSFDWIVYWPDDAQLQQLKDWAMQSDTPYIQDVVLEEAVRQEGAKYLNGSQDLDAAVKAILDSVAIYMTE